MPRLQAPVSRTAAAMLEIETPAGEELELEVEVSNPANFQV